MRHRTKVTAEIARGVLNRRAEGMKHCAIAQEFGISESTVARILIKNGQRTYAKHKRTPKAAPPAVHGPYSYQSCLIVDTSGVEMQKIMQLAVQIWALGFTDFICREQPAPQA